MYYKSGINETLEKLGTTPQGLSKEEVQKRLEQHGLNALPKEHSKTLIEVFLRQFKSPIIYILLIAAAVTFTIQEYTDGYFILAVLFLNALIGTYQEYTAASRAESLKHAIKTIVRVIRNGSIHEVESELLTIGDIVVLESGSKIPADIRLISSVNLMVNESLLTGESLEVHKEADFLSEEADLQVADRKNMVYAGTYVASGRAEGVVTAVGISTEIGKIAQMLASGGGGEAPLVIRMRRLSMSLAKAVGVVVLFLLFVGFYRGMDWFDIFIFAVALAVSAIPEGLPVAITVALTSASLAMSKRNVIVRKLSAIEALGSCTLIASDKTGTLTKNQLSVEHFIPHHGKFGEDEELVHVTHLASVLCNEIKIERDAEEMTFIGDQVDIALAKHAISVDEAYILDADDYDRLDEIPYEPQNRYSAIMVEREGRSYEFVKGSPETVLEFCDLSEMQREETLAKVNAWGAKGYRNIALAYKTEVGSSIALEGFTYLGFMAIIDPLREESRDSVRQAAEAGISVVMVTGDHPSTAFYIASQLGIADGREDIIDGIGLRQWQEAGSDPEAIRHKTVFARVDPEQKKEIVRAFQQLGHYVAVTGDGVNDAPALKYANIGIAMGKSGTDIARSTGDIILTDDNFASIVNGIEEGRRAYDNIRKVIYLLVSTGFAEIVLVTLSFLLGMPLPLLPIQLLWLNLVTNGIQDVMLGLEKAEPGLLKRRPRPPSERIFNAIMLRRTVIGGLYMALSAFALFYVMLEMGYSEYSARNMTLLLMVLFENVHVFNTRSEVNYLHRIGYRNSMYLILLVIFTQLLHIGCMYIPFMEEVLSLEPVTLHEWLMLFAMALGLVVVMEADKWHNRRYGPLSRQL